MFAITSTDEHDFRQHSTNTQNAIVHSDDADDDKDGDGDGGD